MILHSIHLHLFLVLMYTPNRNIIKNIEWKWPSFGACPIIVRSTQSSLYTSTKYDVICHRHRQHTVKIDRCPVKHRTLINRLTRTYRQTHVAKHTFIRLHFSRPTFSRSNGTLVFKIKYSKYPASICRHSKARFSDTSLF